MNEEDFDGSALRELLTPAVADRGRTTAPTDAIVAAGRRRVLGRRSAVAGGALAIVAAVPLAATAIAAGPGTARTTSTAGGGTPGVVAPPHTDAVVPPPAKGSESAPAKADPRGKPASGLPAQPTVFATGTVEGRQWKVTAETAPGNNALTAGEQCLGFVITVDGQNPLGGTDPAIPYCLPVKDPANAVWGYQDWLKYNYEHAAGTVQMGMVKADVAKVVAHVAGLAPVTAETIPAPGLPEQAFYFLPIAKDNGFGVTFDEYDAQGVKIGTFDNSTPAPHGK